MYDSFEGYVKDMVDSGYLNSDLSPKKCLKCDSEDMKQANVDRLDGWRDILEYDMKCNGCGNITGHWAHGCWMP